MRNVRSPEGGSSPDGFPEFEYMDGSHQGSRGQRVPQSSLATVKCSRTFEVGSTETAKLFAGYLYTD